MTIDINLFVSEEIMEENGPWPRQSCQILHRIEVENHDIGQSPHLKSEVNRMQGSLLELTSKNLCKRLKFVFSLIKK